MDRFCLIDVLEKLAEEIQNTGSCDSLQQSVDKEESEFKEIEHILERERQAQKNEEGIKIIEQGKETIAYLKDQVQYKEYEAVVLSDRIEKEKARQREEQEELELFAACKRSNLTSNQNLCDYIGSYELFSSTNTLAEKTPETSWHPQPSTFWLNKEDESFSMSEDLKYHSHLLAWGCQQEKLAITLIPHQSKEKPYESQGTQTKSSVYIFQRQSPQTHFYGYGCTVVQTGSRSLAVLTTIYNKRVNKTNTSASKNISIINNTTENIKGEVNMNKDENFENYRGSFITKPKQLGICKDINQNFTGFISQDNCSLYMKKERIISDIDLICFSSTVDHGNELENST
ncbi:unnamed protein product [Schistosoma bovis]|nr:unnamed protein product [Schistosoma bovis]